MTQSESTQVQEEARTVLQTPNEVIPVSQIEIASYQQFQQAAFKVYQQAVTTYGRRVWSEARSVAHHRDPDADIIEITTPDVERAAIRVEMKLARLRQLRFPFRLVQQFLTLVTGIVAKYFYDTANLPQDSPGRGWLFWTFFGLLILIVGILTLNYYESKAEVLR
jgi:hypothetical protein